MIERDATGRMRMNDLECAAILKPTAEFISAAGDADVTAPLPDGRSLLMATLANTDLESRYASTQWLLDQGCGLGAPSPEGVTELHVLFDQVKHDIARDVEIAKQLIALGADVNAVSQPRGLVFSEIVQMKFTDDDLEPIYQLWFDQPVTLDFETPSSRGAEPIGFARAVPYRKSILERMERYIAERS